MVGVPERRRFRETNSIHCHHPTFQKTKPLSLEDNCTRRILNVSGPYVVECLLERFHGLLQVGKLLVTCQDYAYAVSASLVSASPSLPYRAFTFYSASSRAPSVKVSLRSVVANSRNFSFKVDSVTCFKTFSMSTSSMTPFSQPSTTWVN